jgi:hypothetical protein
MIRTAIVASTFALTYMPAGAQEAAPSTWRDPDTRCVYLKVGDTLSLRYRRDGTPDCASVAQATSGATITQNDFQDLTRSVEALRRDIGGVRRVLEELRRDLERNARR